MTDLPESEPRMAVRHFKSGRECIARQRKVVATLGDKGLPTNAAVDVLSWLEETQSGFEGDWKPILSADMASLSSVRSKRDVPPPGGHQRSVLVETWL
jgi:hypothetical protein